MINEVYMNGGSAGATYTNRYVELRNLTGADIDLTGTSLQYRSATGTGTGTQVTALTGTIPANGYYTVTGTANGGATPAGVAVPGADQTSALPMAAGGGTVILVDGTTSVDPSAANVRDKLGYGNSNSVEGAATAPTGNSVTMGLGRSGASVDTDVNGTDFTARALTPDADNGAAPPADPDPIDATIPEVQGTGSSTPVAANQAVIVEGVVTAAYPAGGFFGFYLQTPGTGGLTDPATRTTSDGLFVRQTFAAGAVTVEPGDTVEVTGKVTEFAGQTQVEVTDAANIAALPAATPVTTTTTATWPATDALKERLEGMLYSPDGDFTVTNNFATNSFGELGLAQGDEPLIQPTEVAVPSTPEADAVEADNAARAITLDDGSSTNFTSSGNGNLTPPYISNTAPIRVGATGEFTEDVILTQGGSPSAPTYRLQPLETVVGDGSGAAPIDVEDTRTAAPDETLIDPDGEAGFKVASFNVLNYFTTLGDDDDNNIGDGGCQAFNDRDGDGNNVSGGCDQRGAWDPADLNRQQTKIVAAINALDADVVGLMEIENSAALGEAADEATTTLVTALNADAGAGTWAANPSSADLDDPSGQDVISNAIIYRTAAVTRHGASRALGDQGDEGEAFGNAREPLAQAFTPVGGGDPFMVVVNHFKSKGSAGPFPGDADQGDGQGASNQSRIRQATALAAWVPTVQGDVDDVILLGDFNSYGQEDPLQVLYDDGYANLAPEGDYSYSFSGLSGSLDHILANESAQARVTGSDVWNINGGEPLPMEYSRFNYHATNFHLDGPYRSSDHDPVVIGMTAEGVDLPTTLNLLNINDFHGRIDANTTKFATTVEQLREEGGEDNTLFLSAGDNIGASLFASAIADDDPTLDVLDALDLRTSAVGNHEFDQGFADLRDDVIPDVDFSYLGANVYREGTTTPVLDEYDIFEVDGVTVGVIGAVTEETPSLVSPAGIEGLEFGDPVEAVNRVAAELSDGIRTRQNGEADVIVAEYHEGAGAGIPDGSTLEEEVANGGAFAAIVNDTTAEVDAIFTGHTHKQYAWDGPVPGDAGRTRPILQTGSYGENIGQIVLTIDPESGDVASYTKRNVPRVAAEDLSYPRVAEVKTITDAALANAATIGNQPIGTITDDVTTAYTGGAYGPDGYTVADPAVGRDDRSSESTLGGLVANALRDGVSDFAEPDLGLTNSGGLRAELLFAGNPAGNPQNTDGVVTFAEANAVLPFNNTVAIVELTGAQLKAVLEQQWQTNPDGTIPSRPYAQLGMSDNVRVTADPTKAAGERITSVNINDVPLDPAATYTVSTLSFLATGGDNFRAFTGGTYTDTGLLDAQLWRDFLADNSPISPDFARQQVFESGLPSEVVPGEAATFTLGLGATAAPIQPINPKTLNLTSLGSPANTTVAATLVDGTTETPLGDFPVTDGIAEVTLNVPAGTPEGALVRMVAAPSGTTVTVPVGTSDTPEPPVVRATVTAELRPKTIRIDRTRARLTVIVRGGGERLSGFVQIKIPGQGTKVRRLDNGRVRLELKPFRQTGKKTIRIRYNGTGDISPAWTKVSFRVVR